MHFSMCFTLLLYWHSFSPKLNHIQGLIPLLILWFLWKAYNEARYQGNLYDNHIVIFQIDNYLALIGATTQIR